MRIPPNCRDNIYPLPEEVCGYGGFDSFKTQRVETGQWVFWKDRTESVLQGKHNDVLPLHVEFAITYRCNYSCTFCSCRAARTSPENRFSLKSFNDYHSLPYRERTERILYHLANEGVGIQWTGGEPLLHPFFIRAVNLSHQLGIKQSIFTNGSLLGEANANALLEAEPVFIRISLNAVTPEVHARFHGLPNGLYAEKVLRNINYLAALKTSTKAVTLVGISAVFDVVNIGEVENIVQFLREVCERHGPGAIDYCILRPAYGFKGTQVNLEPQNRKWLRRLLDPPALSEMVGGESNITFISPSFTHSIQEDFTKDIVLGECLSCGWFSEITPWGDMIICSDKYGDSNFSIGNLIEDSLGIIWRSEKRSELLEKVNQMDCFRKSCPRNGRGFMLNKIFQKIEAYRKQGLIEEVRNWIEDLRSYLPPPKHSFFS